MKMKKKNCPNCGQPITGEKCEYCGTVFIDWAVIDMNTPVFIKFRYNGKIMRARCIMSGLDLRYNSPSTEYCYCDNQIYTRCMEPEVLQEIDIHLYAEPFEVKGMKCNYMIIDENEVDQEGLKEII